ncbi:MAG TPA: hypothetical protein DHW07_03015 [Gammaproteobacteria bacterium]|nr:hypothetical protein [Gammaproteobacteria bacterium]|tara:strand:+ start:74 stop:709 length:636 start_codon:yes stop_codon:yes gene_type:complete
MTAYLPALLDDVSRLCRESNQPVFEALSIQIDQVPRTKVEKCPSSCPTADKCLEDALAAIPPDHGLLTSASVAAGRSAWQESSRGVPEFFAGGYAYASLVDEAPPASDDPIRMGLLLQQAEIAYPGHAHDAEEFYFILSGQAHWRVDAQEFTVRPGDLIHHLPCAIHEMETADAPLLALWVWRGKLTGRFWYESAPDVDCPAPQGVYADRP